MFHGEEGLAEPNLCPVRDAVPELDVREHLMPPLEEGGIQGMGWFWVDPPREQLIDHLALRGWSFRWRGGGGLVRRFY